MRNIVISTQNKTSALATVGIRCEGCLSCGGSNNNTYIASNGNIYVSGSSNFKDVMLIDSKNSGSSELFCNGAGSCQVLQSTISGDRTIKNFKNVFCNGYESCWNSGFTNLTFENIANSVFLYSGHSYGSRMKFNNIGNSVYCASALGNECSRSVISNLMGSVYDIGFNGGIKYSTVTNVTNVYGIGDYSMLSSTILNVKNNIYFIGTKSGIDSTIQNARNVELIFVRFIFFCVL